MRCSLGMYKAHSLNVQIRFINFGNQSIYPVLENLDNTGYNICLIFP